MYTAKIVASSNNVPPAFDATAGSKIISSAPSGGDLTVINTTDSILLIVWGSYLGGVLPVSTVPGKMMSVPPAPSGGTGFGVFTGKITQGDSVFVMTANASARSAGEVWVSIL